MGDDQTSSSGRIEAATVEAKRLRALIPTCAQCEERPAVCFGQYEGGEPGRGPEPACDQCCGHGCEDGWCLPIADLPGWAASVSATARELVEERDALRATVVDLLASAYPHPVEHPTMHAAWARARERLGKYPDSIPDAGSQQGA